MVDELMLWIDDSPTLTVGEITGYARRIALPPQGTPALVVVDYLQLMSGAAGAENRQVEVSAMSQGLKVLARELECPVLALAQLSRSPEGRADKRPLLADLRESGAIEQDADVVMFLYRDEMYDANSADRGIAEVHVAKHRSGPTGRVRLAWRAPVTAFGERWRDDSRRGGEARAPRRLPRRAAQPEWAAPESRSRTATARRSAKPNADKSWFVAAPLSVNKASSAALPVHQPPTVAGARTRDGEKPTASWPLTPRSTLNVRTVRAALARCGSTTGAMRKDIHRRRGAHASTTGPSTGGKAGPWGRKSFRRQNSGPSASGAGAPERGRQQVTVAITAHEELQGAPMTAGDLAGIYPQRVPVHDPACASSDLPAQ